MEFKGVRKSAHASLTEGHWFPVFMIKIYFKDTGFSFRLNTRMLTSPVPPSSLSFSKFQSKRLSSRLVSHFYIIC